MQWIPFTTAILSFIFAAYSLRLFIARKKNCLLIWTIGLLFYGLAGCMGFIIESGIINLLVYRLWYLMGAIFSAAYLAVGVLYCIASRRLAFPLLLVCAVASVYACIILFLAPIDISGMHGLSSRPLPLQVRILSPFFNIAAGLVTVYAVIYGIVGLMKKTLTALEGVGLILIGVGMVLPAIAGIYLRLGAQVSIYTYSMELMGLIVFYVGVLLGYVVSEIGTSQSETPQLEK